MKRFTSYTDESGIINRRKFIVATAIVNNNRREEFEKLLNRAEEKSGKRKKWTDVGVETRIRYAKLIIEYRIFHLCTVYYGIHYSNKSEYVTIVASQVATSLLTYANNEEYNATIFLDKVSNKTTDKLTKELKKYKIRYKKIKGLDDTNNVGLQFIDGICGLIRDINHRDIDPSYKIIFNKLKSIT